MRNRLFTKLFLLLLAVTGTVVVTMLLLTRMSLHSGFVDYLNDIQTNRLDRLGTLLERYYATNGSWEALRREPWRMRSLLADEYGAYCNRPVPSGPEARSRPHAHPGPLPTLRHLAVFDAARQPLFGRQSPGELSLHPLQVAGETVGWIGLKPLQAPSEATDVRFFERQARNLLFIALLMIALVGLASWFLARRLLTPVHALADGARALAAGRYDNRVPVRGGDELAHLSADFNRLAEALHAHEGARRRWVADISHELRTPLAVLLGEIEALQDGVRRPDPAAIASLHQEASRLGKLVDDLYQLALSDIGALSYRKRPTDAVDHLVRAVAAYRPRFDAAAITLTFEVSSEGPIVHADPERLDQLYRNLLENSLRYTERGGKLVVAWRQDDRHWLMDFQDSAPGVSENELPHLFDRLYRGEASRSRKTGGAGLGLAICQKIVEAHHGWIIAEPSTLGGLRIRVGLPLCDPGSEHISDDAPK